MVGHAITQSNSKYEIEAVASEMVLAAEIMKRERMHPQTNSVNCTSGVEATSGQSGHLKINLYQ
jgi:hypothetical protein